MKIKCLVMCLIFLTPVLCNGELHQADLTRLFHPKSIMKMTRDDNSRLYTFHGDIGEDGYQLNNHDISFPLIIDDSLTCFETVYRYIPLNNPHSFNTRYDNILTSLSIATGELDYSVEIFQPYLSPSSIKYVERYWCRIMGVYKWTDNIVVFINYRHDENDEKPHLFIYDKSGKIIGSYGYDAFRLMSIGVDEKHDRLVLCETMKLNDNFDPTMKENPLTWQIDLNSGEVIEKYDYTFLYYSIVTPDGLIYSTKRDNKTNEEYTCIYTVEPFEKIATYPVYLENIFGYWRNKIWCRDMVSDADHNISYKFRAYDPETLEQVDFDESPYHFTHKVGDDSYLIEKQDYVSFRITNLESEVNSWQKH